MSVISLASRLKRAEEKAGARDEVEAILAEVSIWHEDALLLCTIAVLEGQLAEANGEPVPELPTDAQLAATIMHNRAKYERTLAEIPDCGRLVERMIAALHRRVEARPA